MLEEIPEPESVVVLERHGQQYWQGFTLISFPVVPIGIKTIGDFYDAYTYDGQHKFFNPPTDKIFALLEGEWYVYNGEGTIGDLPITPNLGVVLWLDFPSWLGIRGVPQLGAEVEIRPGINLIGLPEVPAAYKRPSDFLSDIICVVMTTDMEGLHLIGREGDPGDNPFQAGEAVILISTMETTLDLTAPTVSAAPSAYNKNLTASWGAMKQ